MYLLFSREYTIMSIMASELYQCKAELPMKNIDEAEIEEIACGSCFGDIHDILIGEIKEEATEFKSISEYGVSNEGPKNNENGEFYNSNLDSSKFEVMLRDSIEDPTDSKISPAHFWKNGNFNGLADELPKQKVNHFNNGVIMKNEGHSESNNDSLTNNVEWKTMTLKNEDDIDIIYEDVKPEICEEKSIGNSEYGPKSNSVADMLSGTEIRPNFSHELSIDSETWSQQSLEDNETAVDTRKESTVTIDSKKCQMIQNLPHCRNPEFYPFESKQDFNEITDTEKKPFQCLSCYKTFDQSWILKRHERVHTGKMLFQCKICTKSFTEKASLLDHETMHTGENPFVCKICSKSFTEIASLLYHETVHTGTKPFECKICTKSFTEKASLLHHESVHTGEKPFQCKICLKSFNGRLTLKKHERVHKGEKPFQCKICPKKFTVKKSLLHHEIIHTGKKTFQCKFCSESFTLKKYLMPHERNHTGEKLLHCKLCSKSFNHKANLTRHERMHTGEKPFQCKICPKKFSLKKSLLDHEMIHTGEKLVKCEICSKSFAKHTLLYHKKIHTGEKPFQCQMCLKLFTEKSYLTRHEKIHTGEKPFQMPNLFKIV